MTAVKNIYFHPLAKFQGPVVWVAFRWRYCWSLWRGTLVRDIHGIHRAYGNFIRVAPNEISVARTDGWTDIHCRRPGHPRFFKNPIWWEDFPGRVPSIVSTTSPQDHQRFRSALSTCFTPSAVLAQETTVVFHVNKMVERLRQRCSPDNGSTCIVNFVEWSKFIVFDIVGDLGFAESFECLDNSALHPWVAELYTYTKVGSLVAALRHYTTLFHFIWRCIPARHLKSAQDNFNWGVEKTLRRLSSESQREDFIGQIQRCGDHEDLALTIPELESNMNLLIQAGSDTCSIVLSGTMNYLLNASHAHKKLVHEIRSSFRSPTEMTVEKVQQLPYLKAVIEEGLRLCPPAPGGLNRVVPAGGDYVCGQWLPGGVCPTFHYRNAHPLEAYQSTDPCFGASAGSAPLLRKLL